MGTASGKSHTGISKMSVPVTVSLLVAFLGIKRRDRKEKIHLNLVDLEVNLREIDTDEAIEAIRFGNYSFRVDSNGQFYWRVSKISIGTGHRFDAVTEENLYWPSPSSVMLKELQPLFAEEWHWNLKYAYDGQIFPAHDPYTFKAFDQAIITSQIDRRLGELEQYVVIGDELFYAIDEPVMSINRHGDSDYAPAEPWQHSDTFRCYSFSELDVARTMAASFGHQWINFDRFEVLSDLHSSPSLLDRRMALLPRWFVNRFWMCLQGMEEFELINFVSALPSEDQLLLKQVVAAARSIEHGEIIEATLDTAEKLLYLDSASRLNFVLNRVRDAYPMIEVLRAEWEARSISVDIDHFHGIHSR